MTLNVPTLRVPPKYQVEKIGGYYHVFKNGVFQCSRSSLAVAVNDEAFNGLTADRIMPETVLAKDGGNVDDTILLPDNVHLVLQGTFKAVNNLNKDLFKNANQASNNHNVFLEGLGHAVIDGNRVNQTADSMGIYFKNANNTGLAYGNGHAIEIRNLVVRQCNLRNILINFAGSSMSSIALSNVRSYGGRYGLGTGLQLMNVYDSQVEYGTFDGGYDPNTYSVYLENCSHITFHKPYINQTVGMKDSGQILFSPMVVDNGLNMHTITLMGIQWSEFYNFIIHSSSDLTANTYDGIIMQASAGYNCGNNIFSGIRIGRGAEVGYSRTYRYGINETDAAQDNNQYCNIQGGDCVTAALLLRGAVSKVQHQNIIGTVVGV